VPTTIRLQDGVRDAYGRYITEITLRDLGLTEILVMGFVKMGQLSNTLKMVARLSGESIGTLTWLTQDDILLVANGLSEHIAKLHRRG